MVLIYGGLYYQKRMFSECLPVTYNPLQGVHACSACSVVLIRLFTCVFNKEQTELEDEAEEEEEEEGDNIKDYKEVEKERQT